MAVPGRRVRIAFGVLPGAGEPLTTDWVDVTQYVRSISIRAGRSQDLNRIEASTCAIEFNNNDARFTPENTSSPYYPNVRPFAQVEVAWISNDLPGAFTLGQCRLGLIDTTLYDVAPRSAAVYRGLAERWSPEWYQGGGGQLTLEVVDLFRYLQVSELPGLSYGAQTVGERIAQVLIDIGNPFPVDIDTTGMALAAGTVAGNALDYMKTIAQLDGGLFYPRGDGKIVFKSRATVRGGDTFRISQAVLGDGPGELQYRDLSVSLDEQLVVNRITGRTAAGVAITPQEDSESQAYYLIRPFDLGDTSASSLGELEQRAAVELVTRAQARIRVDELAYELRDPELDTETLIGLDLAYRVTLNRRPDQGSALSADYIVQGYEQDIKTATWRYRLKVDSAPRDAFILGEALIGSTAEL